MSNLGLERDAARSGARSSCAPRSATAMCSRRCARAAATSAASSRGISFSPTTRPPATVSSRACKCLPHSSKGRRRRANLLHQFEPLPQLLKNVRFNGGAEPLKADSVQKRIAAAEAELEGRGRLVIRKSGTEPTDPRDGRRRRRGPRAARGRRHLRGRSVGARTVCSHLWAKRFHRAHGELCPGKRVEGRIR